MCDRYARGSWRRARGHHARRFWGLETLLALPLGLPRPKDERMRGNSHLLPLLPPLFSLFLLSPLPSCLSKGTSPVVLRGETMGTTYLVKYYPLSSPLSITPKKEEVKNRIKGTLEEINRALSTYLPDSEVSLINKRSSPQEFSLGPLFQKALRLSFDVFEQSEGYFDPSIGPLVNLWGHGPRRHRSPPEQKDILRTLSQVGLKRYKISQDFKRLQKPHEEAYLDFSASAKGLGVDEIATLLESLGLERYMVEIGGEIRVGLPGPRPWRLGIERPQRGAVGRPVQTVVELQGASLATSGNYRNYYLSKNGQYIGHTLNPHTGQLSPSDLLSVSVIHDRCALADAWATGLVAMGKRKALKLANRLGLKALFIVQGPKGFLELKSRYWPKPGDHH